VWRNYGLSITLAVLFLASWMLQTWMGWNEFVADQQAHGEVAHAFGDGGYFWRWGESTFENWQSEFLQFTLFILATVWLVQKGSNESKQLDEAGPESKQKQLLEG